MPGTTASQSAAMAPVAPTADVLAFCRTRSPTLARRTARARYRQRITTSLPAAPGEDTRPPLTYYCIIAVNTCGPTPIREWGAVSCTREGQGCVSRYPTLWTSTSRVPQRGGDAPRGRQSADRTGATERGAGGGG